MCGSTEMAFKDLVENVLGLGRSEDVRRIPVGVSRARVDRAVRSTPGARMVITRDHRDPLTARLLLWCVRTGVDVEIRDGAPGVTFDGRTVTVTEARHLGGDARRPARNADAAGSG